MKGGGGGGSSSCLLRLSVKVNLDSEIIIVIIIMITEAHYQKEGDDDEGDGNDDIRDVQVAKAVDVRADLHRYGDDNDDNDLEVTAANKDDDVDFYDHLNSETVFSLFLSCT